MPQSKPTLKRSLSLPLLTLYGLGNILGAGIYVLVGKVAEVAGLFTPLSFLVAAIIATFTAFTYAELSSRYPLSAGEAIYVQQGFKFDGLSIFVGLLIAFAGMVSAATIANGFVGYFKIFFDLPANVILCALIAVLTLVAFWGIEQSVRVAALLTITEIAGLLLIIYIGRAEFTNFVEFVHEVKFTFDGIALSGIFLGAFLAFYAFIGFEDMVNVAEEVKQPHQNLPNAILLALVIATLLYFLVAYVAIMLIPPANLGASDAPLALLYQQTTGSNPVVISLISMFAVINGALIQIIMAARIFYGMSNKGWLPSPLKIIHPKTQTPYYATFIVGVIVLILAIWLPLLVLAQATSYIILIIFTLINLALIKIKIQNPNPPDVRTYPIWVPIIGSILSIGLLSLQTFSR